MKHLILLCFFPLPSLAQSGPKLVMSDLAYCDRIDSIGYFHLELADTLLGFYGTQAGSPKKLNTAQKNAYYYALYDRLFNGRLLLDSALLQYDPRDFDGMRTALVTIADTFVASNLSAIHRFYLQHQAAFKHQRIPDVINPASAAFDSLIDRAFFTWWAISIDLNDIRKRQLCSYASQHRHELFEFPGSPVFDWQTLADTASYALVSVRSNALKTNIRDVFYEPGKFHAETVYYGYNGFEELHFAEFLADTAFFVAAKEEELQQMPNATVGFVITDERGTTGQLTIAAEFAGFRIQPPLNGSEYYRLTEKGVSAMLSQLYRD